MDEMQELQNFFLEEATELFENSHTILLEAEQNNDLDSDAIDALFRDVHTLKGGSGSVGLDYFAKYVHYLEDFIDSMRKGDIEPTIKLIEFLIQELDTLQDMIDEEINSNIIEDEFEIKLQLLLKNIESYNDDKVDIKTDMAVYSGEFIDLYDSVMDSLHSVEVSQDFNTNFLDRLFRHIHTLKGSSSFMELIAFPKYLHTVEDLLDKARNGLICYTNEFNSALIETMKKAEEIANDEFNDTLDEELFNEKLKDVEELFSDIIEICEDKESEDVGFEIFGLDDDKTLKNSNISEDVGFEIFDFDEKSDKKIDTNNSGFEIFDIEEVSKNITDDKVQISDVVDIKDEISIPEESKEIIKKKTITKTIKKSAASNSIRVGLDKIDFLMNRVGDLVITKSMLYRFLEDLSQQYNDPSIVEKLSRLDREIRELQEAVMSVRMIPMESVYAKLPKTIRDLARKLDKKIEFVHYGDTVEIDKMMVEGLTDPLVHIIRNSLDHGIEHPEDRIKKNKPETGKLTISASQESGHIIITIEDDGAGINLDKVTAKAIENNIITQKDAQLMSDEDKAMLVFSAGLSTAEEVSDVSGRGVGMDVVMNNITSLGGSISIITTKDIGSKFTILLPLTLAILDGLNVKIGEKQLIMPLNMIVESLQPTINMIKKVGSEQKEILMLRNEFIPIIRLYSFFNIEPEFKDITKGMLIITKITNIKVAIFVDDFLNQEQIVVKSLEKNYKKIKGIGAATIRGDGSIGLILDIMNIIEEEKVRLWNS